MSRTGKFTERKQISGCQGMEVGVTGFSFVVMKIFWS